MMSFLDWFGVLANWVQGIFAWATYNRDGFAFNVTFRQAMTYQQQNYHIAWIAVAREDLRNMMAISITRIGNYVIVATLSIGIASGLLASVTFGPRCPVFVQYAFYLAGTLSIIFLGVSIMFGVRGQNSAFMNTMKLLSHQVRPQNPTAHDFNYMTQSQMIELDGVRELFRVPGTRTSIDPCDVSASSKAGNKKPSLMKRGPLKANAGASGQSLRSCSEGSDAETLAPEVQDARAGHEFLDSATCETWYLARMSDFMCLWHPYDVHSKYAMGLGNMCLGQSFVYLSAGLLISLPGYLNEWVAGICSLVSLYMLYVVTATNFNIYNIYLRIASQFLLNIGPVLGVVGATTKQRSVEQILVPIAFLSHSSFWLLAYCLLKQDMWNDLSPKDFADQGEEFWARARRKKEAERLGIDPRSLRKKEPEMDPEAGEASRKDWRIDPSGTSFHSGEGGDKPVQSSTTGDDPYRQEIFGSQGVWPTQEKDFQGKRRRTEQVAKAGLRSLLATSSLAWLALFGWSVAEYWINFQTLTFQTSATAPLAGLAPPLNFTWPGPLFAPVALACTTNRTFVADKFRIYEIFLNGSAARPVQCVGLDRQIKDLSIACDATNCTPLVLVDSHDAQVVAGGILDCGSGKLQALLQDTVAAEKFTVLPKLAAPSGNGSSITQLLVARSGAVVIFSWSMSALAWMPQWFVGSLSFLTSLDFGEPLHPGDKLAAIGTTSDKVLLFRQVDNSKDPAIEVRDAFQLTSLNRWRVPAAASPIAAACARSPNYVLVVPKVDYAGASWALHGLSLK